MAKEKINFKKTTQSTQKFLPIKEIKDGIIRTSDNRFVKIIEVKPLSFFTKNIEDQNKIFRSFYDWLKIAPNTLQFKAFSTFTDLSEQLEGLKEDVLTEKNPNCKKVGEEYMNLIVRQQKNAVTRRYFISFEYERPNGLKSIDYNAIKQWFNNEEAHLIQIFNEIGNEVVQNNSHDVNDYPAEILYSILNRDNSYYESFKEHKNASVIKYAKEFGQKAFVVPAIEYIAPNRISTLNNKYISMDGRYYSYLYFPSNGYTNQVSTGWLNPFISSFEGVDCDVFVKRIPKEIVLNKIKKNIVYSEMEYNSSSAISNSSDRAIATFKAGSYLREGLTSDQDFYYINTLLTVSSRDLEDLDYKVNELKNLAKQKDMRLKDLTFQEEAAFLSALPLAKLDQDIYEKSKRNVLTEGVASTYPFTTFELNEKNGLYWGKNLQNDTLVISDIFSKKVPNYNMFICGKSGAGKTYALLLLALRMRVKKIPTFILAPEKEHEFRRVCNAVGGQFIQIGIGSPNRINIMEIFKQDDASLESENAIDGYTRKISYLDEKIESLKTFFQLLVEDMTLEEKQLLDEAIVKTYEIKGITSNNESLWADKRKTRYKTMPIIADLLEELRKVRGARRLSTILNYLVEGSGNSFNGQTNVALDNEFTVFGLQHLSNDTLPLGIYVAMDYCWSKIKEDRTKKKALFIDEWWRMAFNPMAANTSLEIAKTIRAYRGSLVIATQQMNDILAHENGKYGSAVLGNSATKIIMGMENEDAKSVKDMLNLTDADKDMIKNFTTGEALFIRNNDILPLKFVANKTEHDLITTNGEELLRISKINQEIMKKQNLPDYKDVFVGNEEFEKSNNELVDFNDIVDGKVDGFDFIYLSNNEFNEIERGV